MTIDKRVSWSQTAATVIPLIITMVGIAIASEHRITVVEQGFMELRKQTQLLNDNQMKILQTQERTAAILDIICKRHELEDAHK